MPLYEYECEQCKRRTEKIQKFSDAELTVCPHCGGRLERTITAAAVQFSGGGWYKDLYSSAKPAPASSSSGEGGGAGSSSGDSAPSAGGSPATESAPAASKTAAAAPAPASASTATPSKS